MEFKIDIFTDYKDLIKKLIIYPKLHLEISFKLIVHQTKTAFTAASIHYYEFAYKKSMFYLKMTEILQYFIFLFSRQ